MSVPAERVLAVAERELGMREVPWGSNSGPRVQLYQGSTELAGTGWPWCAAFVEFVWEAAGLLDHPANPSTYWMCKRAESRREFGTPMPGGAIIWCGTHTGIVAEVGDGIVHTIEGNSGHAVRRHVRETAGARFVNPAGLEPPVGTFAYWLEDVGAKVRVVGPWALESWAQRQMDSLHPDIRAETVIVRPGTGGYALRIGRRDYGPWADAGARDRAALILEARLGRQLRPYRTNRGPAPTGGVAEQLGSTV